MTMPMRERGTVSQIIRVTRNELNRKMTMRTIMRRNAGSVPARMIEIISPAGFEHFFRELASLISAGPPEAGQVPALADRYGLQFGEPEWLPDIISRFALTAPR